MVLNLVVDTLLVATILVVADTTLIANMALGVHMLPASSIAVEGCEASVTTVLRVFVLSLVAPVTQVILEILLVVERLVARIAEVNHGDGNWRRMPRE